MSAGVLYVHSCPPALCPHVEWAVAAELADLARGSVTASAAPDDVKERLLAGVDAWLAVPAP